MASSVADTANRHRISASFCSIGGHRRELARHQEVGGAPEQEVAGLGQLHHDHGLVLRELSVLPDCGFHRGGFFRRHLPVRVGHPAEQVGKSRQVARPIRLELIQRVQRLAERSEVVLLRRRVNPQPRTK